MLSFWLRGETVGFDGGEGEEGIFWSKEGWGVGCQC